MPPRLPSVVLVGRPNVGKSTLFNRIIGSRRAIAGADLLIFLVDGREGLIAGDETIAKEIRQTGLPVVLAVNKTDDKRGQAGVSDFYQLGIEPVVEISAEHGHGVGDLLDEVGSKLQTLGFKPETPAPADEAESRRGRLERISAPAGELETTVGER